MLTHPHHTHGHMRNFQQISMVLLVEEHWERNWGEACLKVQHFLIAIYLTHLTFLSKDLSASLFSCNCVHYLHNTWCWRLYLCFCYNQDHFVVYENMSTEAFIRNFPWYHEDAHSNKLSSLWNGTTGIIRRDSWVKAWLRINSVSLMAWKLSWSNKWISKQLLYISTLWIIRAWERCMMIICKLFKKLVFLHCACKNQKLLCITHFFQIQNPNANKLLRSYCITINANPRSEMIIAICYISRFNPLEWDQELG